MWFGQASRSGKEQEYILRGAARYQTDNPISGANIIVVDDDEGALLFSSSCKWIYDGLEPLLFFPFTTICLLQRNHYHLSIVGVCIYSFFAFFFHFQSLFYLILKTNCLKNIIIKWEWNTKSGSKMFSIPIWCSV